MTVGETETLAPDMSWTCLRPEPACLTTWPAWSSIIDRVVVVFSGTTLDRVVEQIVCGAGVPVAGMVGALAFSFFVGLARLGLGVAGAEGEAEGGLAAGRGGFDSSAARCCSRQLKQSLNESRWSARFLKATPTSKKDEGAKGVDIGVVARERGRCGQG